MTKPDPIADELQAVLNAFLKKHPNVAGIVAAGVTTDGGKYVMATVHQPPAIGAVVFDNSAIENVLCETITWNRMVGRERMMSKTQPKQTAPTSRARN